MKGGGGEIRSGGPGSSGAWGDLWFWVWCQKKGVQHLSEILRRRERRDLHRSSIPGNGVQRVQRICSESKVWGRREANPIKPYLSVYAEASADPNNAGPCKRCAALQDWTGSRREFEQLSDKVRLNHRWVKSFCSNLRGRGWWLGYRWIRGGSDVFWKKTQPDWLWGLSKRG